MPVTLQDVDHVAHLARLKLNETEKAAFQQDLNQILTYVEKINELDTATVEPTSHVLPLRNVFRDDCRKPSPAKKEMLQNVPDEQDGFFKVPPVLE
ncbi:MAG: Asp-tRNA(Asn)/Glu-tRNA(Gln) amidotransferase subunit GatC [bacterium]|nr:Asp-tRNA(Asn)/Glu-tRNA(Gln) amidotransferase subunit GatC [bacterium]